jgi:hypothetical protein
MQAYLAERMQALGDGHGVAKIAIAQPAREKRVEIAHAPLILLQRSRFG